MFDESPKFLMSSLEDILALYLPMMNPIFKNLFWNILACVVLTLAQTLAAQEGPKAVLSDEHPNVPCDDTLGRLDAFFAELHNNPGSTGFIVIATSPNNRRYGVFRQETIKSYARVRRFDLDRIKVVRARSDSDMKISLWRIPAGAAEPIVDIDESYEIASTAKPFMFGWEDMIEDTICPLIDHGAIFALFLKANPTARANLVFRDDSRALAKWRANHVVSTFVKKHGIARQRFRVFTLRLSSRPNNDHITEFWYLP